MGLADVTAPSVYQAIKEFDRVGREAFLRAHGYGSARAYFLEHDGERYDSKAIVGYAHGLATGIYLKPGDFSGGEETVVKLLEGLGFTVRSQRNPPWTWDEVVLACALVRDNGWRWVTPEDVRVGELSELLQLHPAHPPEERGPDFRNRNGVARKTADIATQHPDYQGKATNGGRTDREVLAAFLTRPEEMEQEAIAIRQALGAEATSPKDLTDLDLDGHSADEGRILQRLHLRRERNPALRKKAVDAYKRRHGVVVCEACGFNFEGTYGPRGAEYIECHHRTPLHVSGQTETKIKDLILLCSNCHRMIHRTTPWLTPDELVELIKQHRP